MGTRVLWRRWSVVIRSACAVVAVAAASPAAAVDPNEVAIDRMRLATDRAGVLSVESGRVLPHLEMEGAAWLGHANDPLVLHRLGDDRRVASLVGDRSGGALMATVGILDRAQLAIEIPVVLHQARQSGAVTPRSVDAWGFGSIRLVPKVRLLEAERHGVDVAVVTGLSVPVGGNDYIGSELTLQPELAASRSFREVRVAANLGATIRDEARLADAEMGNELSAQLGAAWDLEARSGLPLETGVVLAAAVSAANPFGHSDETSVELRGFGAFDFSSTVRLLAGGGAGLENGWGTPDWRIFAGAQLGFPRRPLPAPGPVPGAFAAEAAAPAPAAPVAAAAPAVAEAPPAPVALPVAPPDTDGDGLADADDRCPAAGGPAENGGCPDEDRDGDAVVDRSDECPDLPGPAEHRGCRPEATVKLEADRIRFEGTIHFNLASDVIQRRSTVLLDGIAAVIRAHPEIERIRVEGHADSRGGRAYNKALSERRAKSVVRALVARGIAADRLVPAGFGLERPVADNATREGRAQNRRVELHVLDARTAAANP
jgi:outer membrane protein OmpA-like peptidoglycan-associated protein